MSRRSGGLPPNATAAVFFAVLAALLLGLAAGLRPDAFFTGDSGVKLIAARQVLDHPSRPLDIDLPTIGPETLPFVEPFFQVHGDHAHALMTELFPILSAPLLSLFGLRGLYILPFVGFLLSVAACAWLAKALDERRSAITPVTVAVLGTPFLFYGLEFWEHSLAVGLAGSGAALLVRGMRPDRGSRLAILAAGLLLGAAALLRPEVVCFAAGLGAGVLFLERRRSIWGAGALLALGLVVAALPLAIYSLRHFGGILPPHLRTQGDLLHGGWLQLRAQILVAWWLPPLSRAQNAAGTASFWSVAPVAVVALLSIPLRPARHGRAFLWTVATMTMLLVLLVSPNDGGSQWGPRYLLLAYLPLSVLASDAIDELDRSSAVALVVLVGLLGISAWVQRSSYRQLRGTKRTYGRIVDFVEETTPGGYLVSDLWWLDQVAASALFGRQFVYAPDAIIGEGILQRLDRAATPQVTVIRSRVESPDTAAWTSGTCYVERRRQTLSTRDLVAIVLERRCQ